MVDRDTHPIAVKVVEPLWTLGGEGSKLGAWPVDSQGPARVLPVVLFGPRHNCSHCEPDEFGPEGMGLPGDSGCAR